MFMLRWLSLAFALFGGVSASQLPEFSQQYRQRLGGALDELNRMLADFDQDAQASNMTRAQAINRMRADSDEFVRQRGRRITETDVRAAKLTSQQKNFETAGAFTRIFVMAKDYDSGIATRTWRDFRPAVPVTIDGFTAAALGFFAALGLWHLIAWPIGRKRRRLAVIKSGGASA